MSESSKPPSWRKNYLIFLVTLGIFLGSFPIFESKNQEVEAGLVKFSFEEISENLVTIQGNSLLPITNPLTPNSKIRQIRVVITGYSSTLWETDENPYLTAAGTWVREGIVANNLLSFGTKVKIPELYGDKVFVVEDRMHWSKGYYHVDIWFSSYWEALNFGAKRTYIEVLEG